jgi:archaemetzincin
MSKESQHVGVIPIGDIPDIAPKVIAAHISGYLKLHTTILKPMDNPVYALDKHRLQYNVGTILQNLESESFQDVQKIVGVLGVDLYVPVFTHVFGEARQGGNVAVVSLFRLGQEPFKSNNVSSIVLERVAKVALHELCHLYDLTHCENQQCLMHFSENLNDLDTIPFYLCRYCARFFRDAIQ